MHVHTQPIPEAIAPNNEKIQSTAGRGINLLAVKTDSKADKRRPPATKPRVFVAAENLPQSQSLSRMLLQTGEIEVVGTDIAELFHSEDLLTQETDILLLASRGNADADLMAVRKVRTTAPKVQILMIGVTGVEAEFLQCVRSGVHGYLPGGSSE